MRAITPPLCAAMLAACLFGGHSQAPALRAELSAAPILGIDRPLRGCAGTIGLGVALEPFEATLRAGAAYDASLGAPSLRFDIGLGLGGGLRVLIGGVLFAGEPSLGDPQGGDSRVALKPAAWPDRFALAATIAEPPWRLLGAATAIEAELAYSAYRVDDRGQSAPAARALVGAAAFAAGVEATLAIRMRWGIGRP